MVRLILLFFCCAAFGLSAASSPAAAFRGQWRCVAFDPRHLVLTGDYAEVQEQLFQKHYTGRRKSVRRRLVGWAADYCFNISGTEAIAEYRPRVTALLRDRPKIGISSVSAPVSVERIGYWLNPIGQARFRDAKGELRLSRNADVAHYLFLTLSRPLTDGEQITITLPAGEQVAFTYRIDTPSPLFKINQVGHLPEARKYAYAGAWLGTAGPLPLAALDGKPFHLVESSGRKVVLKGALHARMADPVNASGTPFTGEEVLEMDFSSVTTPGVYYLEIPGIGRSDTFRIGNDTMAEAFFIHARGLYHQRCGIAKTEPYTHWIQETCHQECFQGSFPPEAGHYGKGPDSRPFGFTDSSGKSVRVNHFELIKKNPPLVERRFQAPGGWHDAADWDRRPQHMTISGELAAVYLLKPENFIDGQLNLPESGNGIPDILDEARWGLEHLRQKQQLDGGVGTWVETTRHPRPGEGMASADKLTYYLSCATRNSSLEYAAWASVLALAMRKAGAEKYMIQFRESARSAWRFAVSTPRPRPKVFQLGSKSVFYREEPDLAPEYLVKAGVGLFLLTGDEQYLKKAEEAVPAAAAAMNKNGWRWSPFIWVELELFQIKSAELERLRLARRRSLINAADTLLEQQERNYPIRVPWYGPEDGWVHTMSWGTCHPLVRAKVLIAAHAMTGDRAYREGALLANDFHNGANPSGSSMTSGLGRVYPVRFLDLNSYADGIDEPIPGITPFRNTYGIPRSAVQMAYGLYYRKRPDQRFPGLSLSLLPGPGRNEKGCADGVGRKLPIWRRWCNVEAETVAASEYSVWETIAPNAVVTGYLLNGASRPDRRWIDRRPANDVRLLPGYAPLP
ncbi:MAG: glycoside hydrolase family 9 protein [Lentisphaeria bacterium]|nr:glycoside hydrolase family 9 protein [Lentisphaeria bacterium]